jgi:anti-anti-sigma regulatory factor
VIDERALASRHPHVRLSTLRSSETPNLQYGAAFNIRIIRRDDDSSVVILLGELDVTSMAQFELMITEVLSSRPKELLFDLTQSQFVSAQGYDAIGRCSLEVPVEVRSRTGVAGRVFAVLGYERVEVISAQEPEVDQRC